MTVKTTRFDVAEYLDTPERRALYLEAAFEDGDPKFVATAIGDVARAVGMAKVAAASGLTREALYRALSPQGNPELATVLKVLDALGVRLAPAAKGEGGSV